MPSLLTLEVCYASPTTQRLFALTLPEPVRVSEAIQASGVLQQFPELVLSQLVVGIFGKKCTLSTLLKSGDRVEIYRPLTIDPMTARRLRAQRSQQRLQKPAARRR